MTLDRYGVFGHPIGHSRSPEIHGRFAAQTRQALDYRAYEVPLEALDDALKSFRAAGGRGLNCTLPLKEEVLKHCGRLSESARRCGAVNTLTLGHDGLWWGDNTDGLGLVRDLTLNLGIPIQGQRLLILGAGGATRGLLAPLFEAGAASVWIANRTPERAALLVQEASSLGPLRASGFDTLQGAQFDLVLNATAASLSGVLLPLPDGLLSEGGCCYDLAYAKVPTPFVRWGQSQGARSSADGIGMLVEQAAESFWIWRGIRPETAPVIEALCGGSRLLL